MEDIMEDNQGELFEKRTQREVWIKEPPLENVLRDYCLRDVRIGLLEANG